MGIEEALKTKEVEDIQISNEDRLQLIDILGCVSVVLKSGKLHFNGPGPHNLKFSDFCLEMARKFSNMKVHNEN